MKHKLVLLFHLILTIFGFICQTPAQDGEPVPVTGIRVLTLDDIDQGGALLRTWKYHPGDDPEWANPTFDDTGWESTNTLMFRPELPESGWEGIGWFRLRLSVPDERLWNMPLALHVLFQAGASEIYLDGELIYKFGTVGTRKGEEKPYWKRDPQVISFSGKTDPLIAIRYSNFSPYQLTPMLGFSLRLAPLNDSIEVRVNGVRHGTTLQMVWTAIFRFPDAAALIAIYFLSTGAGKPLFCDLNGEHRCSCFSNLPIYNVSNKCCTTSVSNSAIRLCLYADVFVGNAISLHALLSEVAKTVLVLSYWMDCDCLWMPF